MYAPLQYTNNIKEDGFSWLCKDTAALSRFNSFMEGQRANRPFWGDWFPVRDVILNAPGLNSDRPLLVDIGGGRGHDLLDFKARFPDAQGKLVLEDLPSVIDEVRQANDLEKAGIETVKYDFFGEIQPVHGMLPHILHIRIYGLIVMDLQVPASTTSNMCFTTGPTKKPILSSTI